MIDPADLHARLRAEAASEPMDIDVPVYTRAGRDPLEPILSGSGDPAARLTFFGRDPGATEVELGEPFIGRGGMLIRNALHRAAHGGDAPSQAAAIAVGQRVFWLNTVPYKPTGNKAWSTKVKRRFAPLILEALTELWQGDTIITAGEDAFRWFALAQPALRDSIDAFWQRDDRFEAALEVRIGARTMSILPLPHPSPLNATWYGRFPAMLDRRLAALNWHGA